MTVVVDSSSADAIVEQGTWTNSARERERREETHLIEIRKEWID